MYSHKLKQRRRASALIMVLWCLIILGMAVFGVIDMVELSVESTSRQELRLEARALASSGIALGTHPQMKKDDPLLAQKTGPGRQYSVKIESEGARLNLNYLLQNDHRDILVNLFAQWGLSIADADHVADCLYDWVTPGNLHSLNGAKADDYAKAGLPQRPTGEPFDSFSEVEQVMGMDLVEKVKGNWQDSFTLWSSGPLNINEAPADLIAAVFGLDPKRVQTFVDARNGRDGIAGTADDIPVADLKNFQQELGISDISMKQLGPQISFNDPMRRVESIGQAGNMQVIISVVTRLNTSPIQYLLWSEQ